MDDNIGTLDRTVRVVVGIALLSLLFVVDGPERWLGLIGAVPLLTAAVGICPLYALIGVSTGPRPTEPRA